MDRGGSNRHGFAGVIDWIRGDLPGWVQAVVGLLPLAGVGGAAAAAGSGSDQSHSTSTSRSTSTSHSTSTSRSTSTHPATLARPVYLDPLPDIDPAGSDGVTPGQVTIDGRQYSHGIQFSIDTAYIGGGEGEASYGIPRGARTFSAAIGNDDNQTQSGWESTALLYEVFVDKRRVATGHVTGHVHDPPLSAM